jgi:hypothetical protein
MGCSPRYPKAIKLINYINRSKIVKNFTNFACGVGAAPIRFLAVHQTRWFPAMSWRECLMEFTVFCIKKTIDG